MEYLWNIYDIMIFIDGLMNIYNIISMEYLWNIDKDDWMKDWGCVDLYRPIIDIHRSIISMLVGGLNPS